MVNLQTGSGRCYVKAGPQQVPYQKHDLMQTPSIILMLIGLIPFVLLTIAILEMSCMLIHSADEYKNCQLLERGHCSF